MFHEKLGLLEIQLHNKHFQMKSISLLGIFGRHWIIIGLLEMQLHNKHLQMESINLLGVFGCHLTN